MTLNKQFQESLRRAAEKRGMDGDELVAHHVADAERKTQRTNELLAGATQNLDTSDEAYAAYEDFTDLDLEAEAREAGDDEQAAKVRENRLRRMADRQGLRLVKSRRRDPRAIGYGGFMIVDQNDVVVAGEVDSARAMDLDAVEHYLTSGPNGT